MADHDPDRFYHCDCLECGGGDHDQERFYHCSCIEDGFDLEAHELKVAIVELRAQKDRLTTFVEVVRKARAEVLGKEIVASDFYCEVEDALAALDAQSEGGDRE